MGLGLAIAAIAPVTGGWKIVLFVAIMILVGVVMPAIWRGSTKFELSHQRARREFCAASRRWAAFEVSDMLERTIYDIRNKALRRGTGAGAL